MGESIGTFVELHVPDFAPIKEFYAGLGFRVLWERAPEEKKGYVVMQLQNNVLTFWGGNEFVYEQSYFRRFPESTPRGYGVEVVLMVDDIDELFARILHRDCVVRPLELKPWGAKDFRVVDPCGYYLRFTEEIDIREPKYAVE